MVPSPVRQRKIGLTGGIASGKTTVAEHLATVHGLPILDADCYARLAVEPGGGIWQRILDRYGAEILLPEPAPAPLDRARLGTIVFGDVAERRWLEAQIHPDVAGQFDRAIAALPQAPILILVIPLLFEANLTHRVTETWVVNCTAEQQRQRLIARNGLSPAEADARIAAQMPLAEKCDRADVVLDNSHSRADLLRQVDQQLCP
ncbi:MAG: dephospho-CoA kinase [Synechococcales cyanobacterium RM1_1_8]|nr:dephospho-CoA kinase [Synechococcales cyanobacterium RM1_1_8]